MQEEISFFSEFFSDRQRRIPRRAGAAFGFPFPGVNDGIENIRATADFIRGLGKAEPGLQLIAYRRMGASKYEACGIRCTVSK